MDRPIIIMKIVLPPAPLSRYARLMKFLMHRELLPLPTFLLFLIVSQLWLMPTAHAHTDITYREKGVTIALVKDLAPLSFIGLNGEPKGLLVDYWNTWSEKTGIPIAFILTNFMNSLNLVRTGSCDIQSGLFINDERQRYLAFSQPLHPLEAALVVRHDLDMNTLEVLSQLPIGVLTKGYAEYFLRTNYPTTDVIQFESSYDIISGLVDGTLDAAAIDYPTFIFNMGKIDKIDEFKVSKILYERQLHAAVAKENVVLLELINKGLTSITTKERNHIASRWFVMKSPSGTWMKILAFFFFVTLAIAVFLLVQGKRKHRIAKNK